MEDQEPEWTPPTPPQAYPIEEALQESFVEPGKRSEPPDMERGEDREVPEAREKEDGINGSQGDGGSGHGMTGGSEDGQEGEQGVRNGGGRGRNGDRGELCPTKSDRPRTPEGHRLGTQEEIWADVLPQKWMLAYVLNLQQLGSPTAAMRAARVSRGIVARYREACPAFAQAIREAQETAAETVESALRVSATVGDVEPVYQRGLLIGHRRKKSHQAAEILLKAEMPEKYRDQDQPLTVGEGVKSLPAAAEAVKSVLGLLFRAGQQAAGVPLETGNPPKVIEGRVVSTDEGQTGGQAGGNGERGTGG